VITTRPGKIIPRPLGFPKTKLYTKFEVPSSSSLWRYVRSYAKNLGPCDRATHPSGKVIYASGRHSICEATDQTWSL